MPGQLPIPLTQKSPYTTPNLPISTVPIVSTITRPNVATVTEDKNQSPVASSTPQTTTSGVAAKVQNTVTPGL